MRADCCHGRAAVGIRASINALQGQACDRADPELAIVAPDDLAQVLSAIFGTDPQDERFGSHQRNECIHVHLRWLLAIACF
jgi:hypothetical protein